MSATNLIFTKPGKEKLVKARAGDITLPAIIGMAFGDGGADSSGVPIVPSEDATSLNNELLRKNIESHSYPVSTTCRYTCTLSESELSGENISELGLYDDEGDLICIKTFTPKGKDSDMTFTFSVDDEF